MSDSRLTELAHAVLQAVVGHWPSVPSVDPDLPDIAELPDRQYVTVGTAPVADCEQLVVSVERTFGTEGSPALERVVSISSGLPWLRTAVFQIQILRCVAVVDQSAGELVVPAPDVISAEARTITTDADAVLECLIAAHEAGELGGCGEVAMENWKAIGEQGGLAGGVTKVRLNLF